MHGLTPEQVQHNLKVYEATAPNIDRAKLEQSRARIRELNAKAIEEQTVLDIEMIAKGPFITIPEELTDDELDCWLDTFINANNSKHNQ